MQRSENAEVIIVSLWSKIDPSKRCLVDQFRIRAMIENKETDRGVSWEESSVTLESKVKTQSLFKQKNTIL